MGVLDKIKRGMGGAGTFAIAAEVVTTLLKNKSVSDEAKRIEKELTKKNDEAFEEIKEELSKTTEIKKDIEALKTLSRFLFSSVAFLSLITASLLFLVIRHIFMGI